VNDPGDPGPSDGPLDPNAAPEEDASFRSQNSAADLHTTIASGNFDDVSFDPQVDSVRVPALMGRDVYAPSVKIGDLIGARTPNGAPYILLASFFSLSVETTRPILAFALQENLPIVVFAAASFATWDEAVPVSIRATHPVVLSYPGMGLGRHLGIGDQPSGDGRLANGLFLIDRPSEDGGRSKFQAVWLPKRADQPHELWHFERTIRILRPKR